MVKKILGTIGFILVIFAIFSYGAVPSYVTLLSWIIGVVTLAATELK